MNGYLRVAALVPSVRVADFSYNAEQIMSLMARADGAGVEVACFPELCLTAYTCQDLFAHELLIDQAETALLRVMEFSRSLPRLITIVGLPITYGGRLYNCAAVVHQGRLCGIVPKTYLPNYKEFYEQRWFASADTLPADAEVLVCGQSVALSSRLLFHTERCTFAIEICEDLWAPIPPSSYHTLAGAEVVFNLSASNDLIGKTHYLHSLIAGQSARSLCAYVYSSCGYGESTQDLIFDGHALVVEKGRFLAQGKRFTMEPQFVTADIDLHAIRLDRRVNTTYAHSSAHNHAADHYRTIEIDMVEQQQFTLQRTINPLPFVPAGNTLDERCEEIICMQSEAPERWCWVSAEAWIPRWPCSSVCMPLTDWERTAAA